MALHQGSVRAAKAGWRTPSVKLPAGGGDDVDGEVVPVAAPDDGDGDGEGDPPCETKQRESGNACRDSLAQPAVICGDSLWH